MRAFLFSSIVVVLCFVCFGGVTASRVASVVEDQVVEFPAPTGSLAIGRTSFRWKDAARLEEMTEDPNDQRELVVHLWYPAQAAATATAAPYFPDLDLLKSEIKWPISAAFRAVKTRALLDAPLAVTQAAYPVILLLHGNEMNSAQYSFFTEELVSHGYVVAGIDSPGEARAVALSNGKTLSYADSRWAKFNKVFIDPKIPFEQQPFPRFYRARVEVRVADASFVLNQLEKLNTEKESRFAGRLNLNRTGIFGHSHGAVAAVNAGIADTRFKACLNLDGMNGRGPYFPDGGGNGPARPFMMLTRKMDEPSDKDLEKAGQTRQQLQERREASLKENFGNLKSISYRVVLNGAKHNSFSNDAMMEAALLKPKDFDMQRRFALIVRTYLLAFFERHLQEKSVPLLDSAPTDYPEVEFRLWRPETRK